MTWEEGQILYRISWAPHSREPMLDVTEYTVERTTPAGGWIYETDCYYGLKKPDRAESNMRPFCSDERIWRKATGNFAHATIDAAKASLVARTKRHRTILHAQLRTVAKRCAALGVEYEKPNPFTWNDYGERS